MKCVIIGGGPAGLIAAIESAKEGNETIILEKMNSCGKKLLITGKGRCNITSSLNISEFIKNIPGNGRFLYSAFEKFSNTDIIELLKRNGLQVKEERGNRIFPCTDKAQDVLNAILKEVSRLNIKIITNAKVCKIITNSNTAVGVEYIKNDKKCIESAQKVILATGGKSYPLTGSTGDGYKIAKELGHTITEIKPSLVPLESFDIQLCRDIQGLSLKNVEIKLTNNDTNKTIYNDFGEMIFTHFGVSGPVILSGSAHLLRVKDIDKLLKERKIKLCIDFKPALPIEKLNLRILRDFESQKNKQFKNSLAELLPNKLINTIVKLSKINPDKQVNEITKEERMCLVNLLKNFEIAISGFRPIEEAIVTAGGVDIKEINPKTMESKLIEGLYFAGEIIDVDAYTGGFNLQIAYSTGFTAGNS